jgi:general secretion pathway protein D
VSQRIIGLLACASIVFLGGCASTGGSYAPLQSRPQPSQPVAQSVSLPSGLEDGDAEATDPLDAPAAAAADAVQLGSGSFLNRDVASRGPAGAGASGEVTFNFEGESLHAVIKIILGDFLQENYVVAPGVQGTVTFSTAKPLRGDQALSILEMLLRWNNATAVWQDGRYTILPVSQALPGNLTPRTGPAGGARGYEVRAVPLQFISAVEMEKLLKPYAKPEGIISVDPARNMLVLAGTAAELANYLQTVEIFDVDWLSGMSVGTYRLEQAEATKVVGELEKVFGEGAGTPLSGMFRFIALEGVNSIIVITPQPRYLAQVQEWIERLDAGGSQSGSRLYVYDVKNVKATDLAGTLGEVFGGQPRQQSASQSGSVAPGLEPVRASTLGRGEQPRFDNAPEQARVDTTELAFGVASPSSGGDPGLPGGAASGPVVDAAGGIALGSEENVRVSAIEENNQLLVKATSQQWESIRRVIERLDQIPLQVHIEARVVDVTLNDELNYGVSWFVENAIKDSVIRGIANNRSSFSSQAASIVDGATNWSFIAGRSIQGVMDLLDSVTRTEVLSAPSVMVLNNKSASVNVGIQIPIQSVSIGGLPGSGIGSGATQNSFTQFLQTGVTLTVTPRVNPGGLVFMEIEQEDSSPGATPAGGGNPPINNKTISTEVAVQSGETLILGGLIKQSDGRSEAGLPFVSRIPVLGALFGSHTTRSDRQELIVLITPRVVASPEEARRVTDEYMRQFRGIQPLRVINETPAGDEP